MLVMLKLIVNDSDRHTVSPSLPVRPRLSQDQQRRGLPVVSTLEVNLEHVSSSSTLSSHLMLSFLSPPPSDEVPGTHDPQCCLFSCWWAAGWLSTAVQRFLHLRICFCLLLYLVVDCYWCFWQGCYWIGSSMLSLFVNSSSRHLFGSISVQSKVSSIILISFRWDYLWHWIRTTFEKEVFRAIHRADWAHSEVLVLNFHAHLQQAKVTSEK